MMRIGIGTDIIACARFNHLTRAELSQLFNTIELDYCLAKPILKNQRLAARFAAKEAAYKALFNLFPTAFLTFKQFLPHVYVSKNTTTEAPLIHLDWHMLSMPEMVSSINTQISISHTKKYATATVLLIYNS